MNRALLDQEIAGFFPGYFALVMATGIVSIASELLGLHPVAQTLLAVNIIAYVVLWIVTLARLARAWPRVWADLTSHSRSPGFFTLVAGTCVLGNQFVLVAALPQAARALWLLALALWLPIMYTFLAVLTVRAEKPPVEQGLNGAWLLAVVAVQSLSVLGVLVAPEQGARQEPVLFGALCLYLLGCMLYLILITLIFYRFIFLVFAPGALTPPYWINMGAVAITTLAGTTLILNAHALPLLQELLPFLKGFTIFFWATATWWIPLLLILGVWRHNIRHFPFTYDPQYWGMVFPLGMYTTCTIRLAQALELPFLMVIPRGFLFLALAAWGAVFAGMMLHLTRLLRAESSARPPGIPTR